MTRSEAVTHFVSYPKSGRTWLRLMIAKYLDELSSLGSSLEDLNPLTVAANIAAIQMNHAGANLPNQNLLGRAGLAQAFAGQRVLFLSRNFEDTLVSSYFQARHRKDLFDGSLSDFIRNPRFGAARLRQYFDSWEDIHRETADFCLIRYERMHQNPELCLSDALMFCGIADPEAALLRSAVDFCGFDNLQRMERQDVFTKKAFRARDTSKVETFKFRQGEVGGYSEHLSADDLTFLRDFLADNRNTLLHSALVGEP